MSDFVQLLREFGFPTFFCVWLMYRVEKELREMRSILHKQVVLNAVIAKTLDVPSDQTPSLPGD